MSNSNDTVCPQCKRPVNNSTNRLVQDMCGHKKCRMCLMQDDLGCKMCEQDNLKTAITCNNILNVSVIKYDGNRKQNELNDPIDVRKVESDNQERSVEVNNGGKNEREGKKTKYKALVIPSHVTVISKSPPHYECTICSKSFHSTTNIKYHLYCTGLEKPLKCTECDKGFITKSIFETHLRSHTGSRPFSCTVCDKRFIQKSKLNRHMKLHNGDLQFVCSECGKKFSTKDGLSTHFRIHTGDKPFSCDQCDSRFSNKSNLNKHLATHSKEKLFMCEHCGKKFRGKLALLGHKKIHSSKKNYACDRCSKAFLNNQDLKRHMIVHKDTKLFDCKLCSTKFRRKDNLDRHVKNTHSSTDIQKQKPKTVLTDKPKSVSKPPVKINKTTTKSSETQTIKPIEPKPSFQEKPNAIKVIKSSIEPANVTEKIQTQNAIPVINGPFKLAFKTESFKHNYNIHNRDYVEPAPQIKIGEPYNMVESLNICQRILSPMNFGTDTTEKSKNLLKTAPKNVITSVGLVNEKDSLEICKKILSPVDVGPLHYETSFENKKHASIKNIKFKLPSTYTNNATKTSSETVKDNTDPYPVRILIPYDDEPNFPKPINDNTYDLDCEGSEYTDLDPVRMCMEDFVCADFNHEHQSVIVNPHHPYYPNSERDNVPPFNEMHWRKRTSQYSHQKKNKIL